MLEDLNYPVCIKSKTEIALVKTLACKNGKVFIGYVKI